jgi:hypothetical protein
MTVPDRILTCAPHLGVATLICTMWTLPTVAVSQTFLPARNFRSPNLTVLRPPALGDSLKSGESQWQFHLGIGNEMRTRNAAFEDGETWRLAGLYRTRDSRGNEWIAELPLFHKGGGLLDPFIDWWHRIVDHGVENRRFTPYGGYGASYRRAGGGRVEFGSGTGWGDLTVGFGRSTNLGEVRAWLKAPTGNPNMLFGSGSWDFAMSWEKTWRLGPTWSFGAQGAMIWQGSGPEGIRSRGRAVQAQMFAAHGMGRDRWLLAQWTSESSAWILGDPRLDRDHRIFTFAYQWQDSAGEWSVYLSEDGDFNWLAFPGGASVGADIALGLVFRAKKF